jgi:hypothetical protein
MPLILDPGRWTVPQLRTEAERHRAALDRMAETISARVRNPANPFALEAGLSLLRRSTELAAEVLRSQDPDPGTLVAVVNQLYETMVVLPLFLRAAETPPRPLRSPAGPPP